jgi:alpha-glucosidase
MKSGYIKPLAQQFLTPCSLILDSCLLTLLLFLSLVAFCCYLWQQYMMAGNIALALGSLFSALLATVHAQTTTSSTPDTTSSYRAVFTVPAEADASVLLLPNIQDNRAINAQDVCPGYIASSVLRNAYGFTASLALAGDGCNVYGTDVDYLNLTVEYQSANRLHVQITPSYVDASNSSWYVLPEELVNAPKMDVDAETTAADNEFDFVWSNEPSFGFSVIRQSTGDIVFSTQGTKLVFENQFIEFVSSLPENYNLYGMGEVIHGLRMGNNLTRTFWAADVGDPIDYNIYGDHPFYLDTRYYEVNQSTGNLIYAANATNSSAEYVSYSHGVYLRNAHGQEALMRADNITWRTLGGSIDLFFYDGPTQKEVTKAYQMTATGLPAMQQYFTFGYHQCRWGYANWTQLQEVVDEFAAFDIPLENIW